MSKIKLSLDNVSFLHKPSDEDAGRISSRIARLTEEVESEKLVNLARDIGLNGKTFCPATFKNGIRNKENFNEQQFFALDFDGGISFEEVRERADHYDLPMLFAYDTLSSKNHDKFRVAFLNDAPVTDIRVAKAMQKALVTMFPESDPQCKSVVQMYYGGDKEMLHLDRKIPAINAESLFRNLVNYFEDEHGKTNIRRHTELFSHDTGLALDKKGRFDVKVTTDISDIQVTEKNTENVGALEGDKNSPTFIIHSLSNIKGVGEKLSKSYCFNFDCTSPSSVAGRNAGGHATYRSVEFDSLGLRCRLYRE